MRIAEKRQRIWRNRSDASFRGEVRFQRWRPAQARSVEMLPGEVGAGADG